MKEYTYVYVWNSHRSEGFCPQQRTWNDFRTSFPLDYVWTARLSPPSNYITWRNAAVSRIILKSIWGWCCRSWSNTFGSDLEERLLTYILATKKAHVAMRRRVRQSWRAYFSPINSCPYTWPANGGPRRGSSSWRGFWKCSSISVSSGMATAPCQSTSPSRCFPGLATLVSKRTYVPLRKSRTLLYVFCTHCFFATVLVIM